MDNGILSAGELRQLHQFIMSRSARFAGPVIMRLTDQHLQAAL
ncbi:hypothetical protein B0I18_101855 [Taibaiella chishuiensis]|uniref:Uncharacterized protein n=1 Tax=Taibaiella chishuiensis TaxID=1434707 RepID=A0A2P8DBY7_9BACT|nr:hypothetical protein B0I18_101855 [Taibaiella chishuiensis]